MKTQTKYKVFSVVLALCFLSVSILATTTTAKHANHAGHDQTTHQQTWCGWLCAAGQAIQTPSFEPSTTFELIAKTEPFIPSQTSLLLCITPQSRAPPTFA